MKRLLIKGLRALLRLVHPKTLGRTGVAIGAGFVRFVKWSHRYTTAADKIDMRMAGQAGPVLHEQLADKRQFKYWTIFALVLGGIG